MNDRTQTYTKNHASRKQRPNLLGVGSKQYNLIKVSNCSTRNWHVFLVCSALLWTWPGNVSAWAQVLSPLAKPQLVTKWASEVSATNVHPEYPRPMMRRPDWLNLNGLWDYGVTFWTVTNTGPFNEDILVPFPVESVMSGVKHHFVMDMQRMWYRRGFTIPQAWHGRKILLHFEGANWETRVWVNGKEAGSHRGGYDRFSFDITDALRKQDQQELLVSVWNPGETGFQQRGKQMFHPRPPFFTASSGIWQTVWLEPVPETSIESLRLVPDIDAGILRVTVLGRGETNDVTVEAVALDGEKQIGVARGRLVEEFELAVPNAKLWSPDNPFLYNLKVRLISKGKELDSVSSYFGMRKISIARDAKGFPQILLNNKRLFELGPLDQGYWPDGIYTAPTDEALRHDIETMKQLGFNMCRKHVKVEPDRWYYWCDKLGLLVWQDMPNGDRPASSAQKEIQRRPESARQFEFELKRMILGRGNHPCIVLWTLFNQGWGQYDTARITDMVKQLDPSRLVVSASGWFDLGTGDVRSVHQYQGPIKPEYDGKRPFVVGECGGLGLVEPDHNWGDWRRSWNTTFCRTPQELVGSYRDLISELKTLKDQNGLAAAVITQLTDVETEVNGFMTYDRAVIKMPAGTVKQINEGLTGENIANSIGSEETNSTPAGQK